MKSLLYNHIQGKLQTDADPWQKQAVLRSYVVLFNHRSSIPLAKGKHA